MYFPLVRPCISALTALSITFISLCSQGLLAASTDKSPDRKGTGPQPRAVIVGNTYPKDLENRYLGGTSTPSLPPPSLRAQIPDFAKLHGVVARISAKSPVFGEMLRQALAELEASQSVEDLGDDYDYTPVRTAKTSDLPADCLLHVKNFNIHEARHSVPAINKLHLTFSKTFYANSTPTRTRVRTLLRLLVGMTIGGGTSGTAEMLTDVGLAIGLGEPVTKANDILFKTAIASLTGSVDFHFDDRTGWHARNAVALETDYVICTSTRSAFQRWHVDAPHATALQAIQHAVVESPDALERVRRFIDELVQGKIPVFVVKSGASNHYAKVQCLRGAPEVVVSSEFLKLPIFDDRPLAASKVKVLQHEGIHWALNHCDNDKENTGSGRLSSHEFETADSGEAVYRLTRGLPLLHSETDKEEIAGLRSLRFPAPPTLWSTDGMHPRNFEWLRITCISMGQLAREQAILPVDLAQNEAAIDERLDRSYRLHSDLYFRARETLGNAQNLSAEDQRQAKATLDDFSANRFRGECEALRRD